MSNLLTRCDTEDSAAGVEDLSTLVNGAGDEEREEGLLEHNTWSGQDLKWNVNGVGIGCTGAELRASVRIRFWANLGGFEFASSCLDGMIGDTLEPSLRVVGGVM